MRPTRSIATSLPTWGPHGTHVLGYSPKCWGIRYGCIPEHSDCRNFALCLRFRFSVPIAPTVEELTHAMHALGTRRRACYPGFCATSRWAHRELGPRLVEDPSLQTQLLDQCRQVPPRPPLLCRELLQDPFLFDISIHIILFYFIYKFGNM